MDDSISKKMHTAGYRVIVTHFPGIFAASEISPQKPSYRTPTR
jgi:hypothetical protein